MSLAKAMIAMTSMPADPPRKNASINHQAETISHLRLRWSRHVLSKSYALITFDTDTWSKFSILFRTAAAAACQEPTLKPARGFDGARASFRFTIVSFAVVSRLCLEARPATAEQRWRSRAFRSEPPPPCRFQEATGRPTRTGHSVQCRAVAYHAKLALVRIERSSGVPDDEKRTAESEKFTIVARKIGVSAIPTRRRNVGPGGKYFLRSCRRHSSPSMGDGPMPRKPDISKPIQVIDSLAEGAR
jgi:hypothetical protein